MSSDKELPPTIGERVRAALVAAHVSQNEVSRRTGVSQSFISAVCRGESKPSIELVAGLREHYGVSLEWIVLGRGAPFAGPEVAAASPMRPDPVPPKLRDLVRLLAELQGSTQGRRALRAITEMAEIAAGRETASADRKTA